MNFAGAVFRTMLGAVIMAGLWAVVGWLVASWTLGAVLAAVSLVLGPLFAGPLVWIFLRLSGKAPKLEFARHKGLAKALLAASVKETGPNPRFWVLASQDLGVMWWQSGSRQNVLLSQGVLSLEPQRQIEFLRSVWSEMAQMPQRHRQLRTLQIALWMGSVLVLELCLWVLGRVLRLLGFKEFPEPAFFLQNLAWRLRSLWFGVPSEESFALPPAQALTLREPEQWNWMLWGTWFSYPLSSAHPTWLVLTHKSAFRADLTRLP